MEQQNKGELIQISVNKSTKNIINSIQNNDISGIAQNLSQYQDHGRVNTLAVIKTIPIGDRLPQLVKKSGRPFVAMLLSVILTSAFEKINLRVGMSARQIVALTEEIINSSEEDQLALEDVMLFLQQLVRGEAGKIYDRMDTPVFFEMFEKYRESRHRDLIAFREEEAAQFKCLPVNERLVEMFGDEKEKHREAQIGHLLKKENSDKFKRNGTS